MKPHDFRDYEVHNVLLPGRERNRGRNGQERSKKLLIKGAGRRFRPKTSRQIEYRHVQMHRVQMYSPNPDQHLTVTKGTYEVDQAAAQVQRSEEK